MKDIKQTIAEIEKGCGLYPEICSYCQMEKRKLIEGYLIAIENEIEFLESCKLWNGTRPLEIRDKVLLEELDIKIKELKQKVGA
jgi:hypothetical protein